MSTSEQLRGERKAAEQTVTVLVADDDEGYRFPLRALFEDGGFNIIEVSDTGGVIAEAQKADVWVVDVRLPTGKEGILAVRKLVENGTRPSHPVIFISVFPRNLATAELEALTDASVQYRWVEKPFELESILDLVKQGLGESGYAEKGAPEQTSRAQRKSR